MFDFWLSRLVSVGCDALPPFIAHQTSSTTGHRNVIKAVKMTPMARSPKRWLAGRSIQIKKARIAVEGELEAQALLQSEEATGPHSESEESMAADSENESDVEFNQ